MTLGLMVGSTSNLSGLSTNNTGAVDNHADSYGTYLGNIRTGTAYNTQNIGVTTDSTKSGIIVEQDTDIKLVIKY